MQGVGTTRSVGRQTPPPRRRGTSMEEIQKEYSLKRNKFNPDPFSPNVFVAKLELRMRAYYTTLYRSRSFIDE